MVISGATSVEQYLKELPANRRRLVVAVRDVIRRNLPKGFAETMAYGMITWGVPLSRYPDTYNGQPLGLAALAAQKHYYALYLWSVYSDVGAGRRFRQEYAKTGRKLDMGKSCVRFKSLDDLPLDLIGRTIAGSSVDGVIAMYEKARDGGDRRRRAAKKTTRRR